MIWFTKKPYIFLKFFFRKLLFHFFIPLKYTHNNFTLSLSSSPKNVYCTKKIKCIQLFFNLTMINYCHWWWWWGYCYYVQCRELLLFFSTQLKSLSNISQIVFHSSSIIFSSSSHHHKKKKNQQQNSNHHHLISFLIIMTILHPTQKCTFSTHTPENYVHNFFPLHQQHNSITIL